MPKSIFDKNAENQVDARFCLGFSVFLSFMRKAVFFMRKQRFIYVFITFYKNQSAKKGVAMTDYQKNKIFEFRMQGMGYKAIGNILGLSRDIVRNFCKRCGLGGSAEVIQKNINIRIDKGILCGNCGKPIKRSKHGRKRRFCSDVCRRDWWKQNQDKSYRKETAMYKCLCRSCGKEFVSYGNKNRRYCCHSCYIADRFGGNDDGI